MQNGNQKKEIAESDITEKIYKKDKDGEIKDLKSIRDEFKSVRKHEASCFFLKAVDMYILSNIPNFLGLNISIGFDKEKKEDVLIVVPVIRGSAENVYDQTYTVNGETTTTSTVVMLGKGPCPPYPAGCRNCSCT
jgi:hypothetical protein